MDHTNVQLRTHHVHISEDEAGAHAAEIVGTLALVQVPDFDAVQTAFVLWRFAKPHGRELISTPLQGCPTTTCNFRLKTAIARQLFLLETAG